MNFFPSRLGGELGPDILAYASTRRARIIRLPKNLTRRDAAGCVAQRNGESRLGEDNKTLFYASKTRPRCANIKFTATSLARSDEINWSTRGRQNFVAYIFKTKSEVSDDRRVAYQQPRIPLSRAIARSRVQDLLPREREHDITSIFRRRFLIRTNDHAKNFRLMWSRWKTGEGAFAGNHSSRMMFISAISSCLKSILFKERARGLTQIESCVVGNAGTISSSTSRRTALISVNLEFDTTTVRFEYTSMKRRCRFTITIWRRDKERCSNGRKCSAVRSGALRNRAAFCARAGRHRNPDLLLYRKARLETATIRFCLWLGSYGFSSTRLRVAAPEFGRPRFCLTITTCAGQEMGRRWYEDASCSEEKHVLRFIACAEFLIHENSLRRKNFLLWAKPGLIDGRDQQYAPICSKGSSPSPFVDVMTTMLDASIPLRREYDEWAIRQKEYYDYMLLTPLRQRRKKTYPAMLITGGCTILKCNTEPANGRLNCASSRPTKIAYCSNQHGGRPWRRFGRFRAS